jgi:hypothetical protein
MPLPQLVKESLTFKDPIGSLPCSQKPANVPYSETLCNICSMLDFTVRILRSLPNLQAGGSPIVGCPRLLIQHIRSYPPYLKGSPPSAT